MELEEDEAQVCRLCGQYESIYINVFGEEGTKRYLGFKIHSKINILIDERDPLPKAICVQCLGKLEFVCDFQEECLRTQQLLRDQYNVPPLSDLEESKPEDSAPSTSASTENNIINNKENTSENNINNSNTIENSLNNNNNNNNCDKNFNPPQNQVPKDENRSARNTTKSQRSLRSQQNQAKSNTRKDAQQLQIANNDVSTIIQQPEITTTMRRLRSRQSIDVSEVDNKNTACASIVKKRLRSHNNTADSTTNSKVSSNVDQNTGKKNYQVDHNNKIQIPTNTLNKVLSAITNAPGIGVSVKESTNRSGDAEDISFTVELCKKQETDSLTVLAKVFPDQGSCLVDKSIVTFLEDGTNEEVNNLVNNIVNPNACKDENRSLIDKLQNAEDITNSSRNPEELFKMDGEEIHVDENVEQVNVNNQIKPDDGLPQVICMRCLGTLEFLCDFHKMCHDTQKDLELTLVVETDKEAPKDKLESDAESDKENVLPSKCGKRKGKSLQSEHSKLSKSAECDENLGLPEPEVSNNPSVQKSNNALALELLPTNDKDVESPQEGSDATISNIPNDQSIEKEINIETNISKTLNKQTNKISKLDNAMSETVTKNSARRSRSVKCEKNEKKVSRRSKTSPSVGNKNKKVDSIQLNKTIDEYFAIQCQYKVNSTNEENVNPNNAKTASDTNTDKDVEQENVIFEGTVINSTGDTSIIMPLKTESYTNELRLDNVVMADGSEIVQAQEIVWISNNSELREPEKPKTINSNQSKTVSPAPGDEAETVETDGTLVIQTSPQDINVTTSTEQLIVLEVQLPAKENSVALPKSAAALRRKRSISTTSSECRFSEGRYAKISELMTEEQKRDIETHYSIDMTLVDESKVDKNIITLDKCKFQCKICEAIYPRLDKCQVHIWRHLDMKPYLCKVCDFSTLTVSNVRCHIRKSHLKIKPFECHLCKKRYNSSTLLEEHINIHTGSRPHQCSFCEFASTSKQVLAHHVLIHKSEKDIICDICGKAFYSKGRMRAHQITHNKGEAFKCTLCSTYVLHEEALERHYMNVHTKDYVCKICNKVYKSRKALHNHESVHSDAKFKCPMCPNMYKSTHILKEHILKHQGIRQYKCNSCDKSFAQQSHLAAHMAVHSDVTYNCPGCQKGFNRHDNMKVHAKRCERFLANPELQNLLTKRKISFSKNNTAKVSTQKENDDLDESKKKRKTLKSRSKKTATEKPVTEDSELNDNKMAVVENVLTSQEY